MATKKTLSKSPPQPPTISPTKGIELIEGQIEAGNILLNSPHISDDAYNGWECTTVNFLKKAFGEGSNDLNSFYFAGPNMTFRMGGESAEYLEAQIRARLASKVAALQPYIDILKTDASLTSEKQLPPAAPLVETTSRKVFIVHGHNVALKEQCARLLEKLALVPIILHEHANKGRTIIEKFHSFADVGFAVVLLTADDMARIKANDSDPLRPRARQNVMLEFGFFLGKLGREKVCAIHEEGVEIPSDYNGVLFIPHDALGAWRMILCRELIAAGIEVDANKAL